MSALTALPLSVKWMVRISLLQRLVAGGTERAIDRLGGERQRGEPHADRILDRIRDRRRYPEGSALAHALGAERTGALLRLDRLVGHVGRDIEDARNLVVREGCVGHLAG